MLSLDCKNSRRGFGEIIFFSGPAVMAPGFPQALSRYLQHKRWVLGNVTNFIPGFLGKALVHGRYKSFTLQYFHLDGLRWIKINQILHTIIYSLCMSCKVNPNLVFFFSQVSCNTSRDIYHIRKIFKALQGAQGLPKRLVEVFLVGFSAFP